MVFNILGFPGVIPHATSPSEDGFSGGKTATPLDATVNSTVPGQ